MTRLDRYTCEEAFRRMDDFLDRELSEAEVVLVRQHLETCTACAHEYAFEGTVLRDLKDKLRRVALPPDLAGRIAERLREARAPDESTG